MAQWKKASEPLVKTWAEGVKKKADSDTGVELLAIPPLSMVIFTFRPGTPTTGNSA